MHLFDFPAPSPRRVRIFLAEKRLTVPTTIVDLASGAQFDPSFRTINPSCTVPVLTIDDGTAISEVPAIWRYLEAIHPTPVLLGRDAREQAIIMMWDRRMELDGYFAAAEAFRNSVPAFAGHAIVGPHEHAQIPAVAERGRTRVVDFYRDLDHRLRETPYLAGDIFTAADITGVVTVDFATDDVKIPIPEDCGALSRWHDRVKARDSYLA